jgi:hypothetical protein
VESPRFAPAEQLTKFVRKANREFSESVSDKVCSWLGLTAAWAMWDNPTMTLTADSKKRVVLPGAAPGDVFACERKGPELILRRVHRRPSQKKRTKEEVLKAIRNWKSVPKVRWEELRKMTREV